MWVDTWGKNELLKCLWFILSFMFTGIECCLRLLVTKMKINIQDVRKWKKC